MSDDVKPSQGPINQPVEDGEDTAPATGPTDDPIDDDPDDLSPDDALESKRVANDPNESTLHTQDRLSQDFDPPAAPAGDPVTRELPADHPSLDELDKDEVYNEDETDASDYWDQHVSNDRKNDALYGDNGPDL